jgi:hypothetical protein
MDVFKTHLQSHLAPAITETVLDTGVLAGLTKAIGKKRREWTPATNMTRSQCYKTFYARNLQLSVISLEYLSLANLSILV